MKKNIIEYLFYVLLLTIIFNIKANIFLALVASILLVSTFFISNYFYHSNKRSSIILVIGIAALGQIIAYKMIYNDVNFFSIVITFISIAIIYKATKSTNRK